MNKSFDSRSNFAAKMQKLILHLIAIDLEFCLLK